MFNKIKDLSVKNHNHRDYESEIINDVIHDLTNEQLIEIHQIMEQNEDLNIKFAALFILVTYYRRSLDFEKLEKLFEINNIHFKNNETFIIYDHLKLLFDSMSTYSVYGIEVIVNSLDILLRNNKLSNHSGVLHFYAISVAEYLELVIVKSSIDELSEENIKILNKAITRVNEAIAEEDYPKFYFTKGRLLLLDHKFDEAINYFILAIEKEDKKRKDYSLTISSYKNYIQLAKQLNQTKKLITETESLKKQKVEIDDRVKKLESNNFRVIGMFSTIFAFIISNISMAIQSTVEFTSIILMNGVFIILFGLILLLTDNLKDNNSDDKNKKRIPIILIVTGVVFIIAAFAFYLLKW